MLRSAVALAVVLALSGCSLINPYVVGPSTRSESQVVSGRPDLPAALAYAAHVKDAYRDALGDQARLQAWLGIGLIPLSAAALGLGATGGPAEAILALGLAGATGFGTATWLHNRPRQAAYVAGIKAVTCAEAAVTPLLPLSADGLAKDFAADLSALSAKIPVVDKQIAIVAASVDRFEVVLSRLSSEARLAAPEHDELLRDAKAELATARSLVSSAEAAYSSGRDVDSLLRTAGERLRVAIENIVATIDGMIVETQRDPQALTAIISGLGGTYKALSTVPEALKSARPSATPSGFEAHGAGVETPLAAKQAQDETTRALLKPLYERLVGDLETLRQESATLSDPRRKVAAVVNMVTRDAPVKALESCGVKAADVVTALVIDPAPPYELGKASSQGFVVRGGVPPYWASVKGPSDGITVVPVQGSSSAFNLTAAKDAPAGTYVLNVIDSAQGAKTAQVTVKDGAPAPPPPVGKPATGATAAQVTTLLKERKDKTIDVAGVTLRVTDVVLEDGKAVVSATVESTTQPKLDSFTQEALVKALLDKSASDLKETQVAIKDFAKLKSDATARSKLAAACASIQLEKPVKSDAEPLFTKLPQADREKLQVALCHKKGDKTKDADGIWGPETKHSLKLYQCRTGREPDGKLTDKLVQELLSLGPDAIAKQCAAATQ